MNLVALSTVDWDPDGHITIDATPDTTEGAARRRITRSATLDGGAVFNDFGFADADRTITIKWEPNRAIDDAVERMVELHGRIVVSVGKGVYLAAPELYQPGTDQSSLRLLVAAKLSE